jgi:hypothetical protein
MAMLAHLIHVIHPLAKRAVSSEFSDADRQALRNQLTDGRSSKLFATSTFLAQLCSPTAFKQFDAKQS